ncbi:hypothetical protein D9M71_211700 [compost metagenome]
MVAQDGGLLVAQGRDDALAHFQVQRNAFVVVVRNPLVEGHVGLVQRQQPFFQGSHGHAGQGMRMHHTDGIVAVHVNGAMDGETRGVHFAGAVVELAAVDVDGHQVGGGDLLRAQAVLVDQESRLIRR